MIEFILNDQDISTDQPPGSTVLDFVRYHKNLKGTKIGCREGDCGACTVLVGELQNDAVKYRTMTSCLMPLANASGKHIVTIEGINPTDGSLTPVQQAIVDENGTQCGFCTVGFVMSLTGFCIDRVSCSRVGSLHVSKGSTSPFEDAISSIDGNICRCTGYKSIERAGDILCQQLADGTRQFTPSYFADIPLRLTGVNDRTKQVETRAAASVPFIAGGTDVYVQKPDELTGSNATHVLYDNALRGIRDLGHSIEIGASATVTDLLESPIMHAAFPDLYKHLKLVSSTPIRNMATLAGNFINASPIGDMTIWFLALNAEIVLNSPPGLRRGADASSAGWSDDTAATERGKESRTLLLKQLYVGYKQLAKEPDEYITAVRFKKPTADHYFSFEKVCKRTYLDIATVNTAISLKCESFPGKAWKPPALAASSSPPVLGGVASASDDGVVSGRGGSSANIDYVILDAHIAAGGVAPIPLYLKETSSFLIGRTVNAETIEKANEIMQLEISPISDVRGTEEYKRLLLRQLFHAHFYELFGIVSI